METGTSDVGMRAFQQRLKHYIGDRSRPQIATRATEIAIKIWGRDAPDIDEKQVRDIDTRLVNPPADGRVFRCVLAAVGMPAVEALTILGYWPDANIAGGGRSIAQAVTEAMRIVGYPDARLVTTHGRRIVIEL